MATIDLDELRKEIEVDRKSLAEKEAVLHFLEKKEKEIKPADPVFSPIVEAQQDGFIQLDQLEPATKRPTFITDVQDVVSRFGDQEFTVIHVDAVLKKMGKEVKGGKFPRSRISTVLAKLEEQGLIVRTFKGGGNSPNRYKLKVVGSHDLV